MNWKKLASLGVVAMMSLSILGCGSDTASNDKAASSSSLSGSITGSGSSALLPLAKDAADKFKELHPEVSITLNGGGSGTGLKQVADGSVDIGNSDVAADTKLDKAVADGLVDHKVCVVTMAPVVNKDIAATVKSLTKQQLTDIFTAKITNWKEVGGADEPIIVIGREAGSGTRGAFEELVDLVDGCKYANELDSTGAVIAKVASTPGAIGYASLDALDDSVKALSLEGVEATAENIKAGNYFLSRPFVMATKGEISEQNDLVQAWFDFVLGDEGQQVASEVGLITVK